MGTTGGTYSARVFRPVMGESNPSKKKKRFPFNKCFPLLSEICVNLLKMKNIHLYTNEQGQGEHKMGSRFTSRSFLFRDMFWGQENHLR